MVRRMIVATAHVLRSIAILAVKRSHGQGRVHGDAARQADGLAPGQFVAAKGADLFWWREQRLPPPEGIDAFLKDGAQIRDLLVNG